MSIFDLFRPSEVGVLKSQRDVRRLIKGLRMNPRKRRGYAAAAATALGGLGDAAAVEPLIAALALPDETVRAAAAEALGRLRDPRAVEPLIAALVFPDPAVREAAANALATLGDSRAVEPLIAALASPDRAVRVAAANALGALGDSRAVVPLIGSLQTIREPAVRALGRLKDPRAAEPLVRALRDGRGGYDYYRPDPGVAICEALAEIGGEVATEAVERALVDEKGPVRAAAARALNRLGRGDWSPSIRGDSWDIDRLVESGHPRAFELLSSVLADRHSPMRPSAVHALGKLPGPEADDVLMVLLEDRGVCHQACDALGSRRCQRAAGALAEIVVQPTIGDSTRAAALRALLRLDGDHQPTVQYAARWRERLSSQLRRLDEELASTPEVLVYPTLGDAVGPYADMYGREEERNPAYDGLLSDASGVRAVIEIIDEALASVRPSSDPRV